MGCRRRGGRGAQTGPPSSSSGATAARPRRSPSSPPPGKNSVGGDFEHDVYVPLDPSKGKDATVAEPYRRHGSTSRGRTYAVPCAAARDLKEMGAKLRRSREKERRGRREVLQIDDADALLDTQRKVGRPSRKLSAIAKTNACVVGRNADESPNRDEKDSSNEKYREKASDDGKWSPFVDGRKTAKRKRRATASSGAATTKKAGHPKKRRRRNDIHRCEAESDEGILDTWHPDASSLDIANKIPDVLCSDVVRVHGLPLGADPDHVKKLFAGLDMKRVFTIPRYDVPIQGFDCLEENQYEKKEPVVQRINRTFRVFVKFGSKLAADMASKRSGEVVSMMDQMISENKRQIRVAVTVVPVLDPIARFVDNCMAINGIKGEPFLSTVIEAERQLHPIVAPIVWAMAAKLSGWKLSPSHWGKTEKNLFRSSGILSDWGQLGVPTDVKSYRVLASIYNKLWDQHERLDFEASPLLTHEWDPNMGGNSILHLTSVVSHWFLAEMENIELALCQSRREMASIGKLS